MEAAMIAREMRPRPGVARQPVSRDEWEEPEDDPMNPVENIPSELDPLTHAEFIAVYNDASPNIRFAKEQQWRTVLYFTIAAIAVTTYGEISNWADPQLSPHHIRRAGGRERLGASGSITRGGD